MTRSFPGSLRLIVAVALAGFWLATLLVVALVASWPTGTVMVLAIGHAAVLATILCWQAGLRTRAATGAGKHRARPSRSAFGVSSPVTTQTASSGSSRSS
jgi:hypothetical protein